MRTLLIPAASAIAATLLMGATTMHNSAVSTGKSIFLDNKCDKCHTISSQGIDRSGATPPGKLPPDLSGVGLKHNADWIKGWLLKEEELNGKKHLKKWTGSDDDLKTLCNWLASQKKK